MHETTTKHAKEQVHVLAAVANYVGNRNVLRLDVKTGVVGVGPVNEKALWPAVVSLVPRTLEVDR